MSNEKGMLYVPLYNVPVFGFAFKLQMFLKWLPQHRTPVVIQTLYASSTINLRLRINFMLVSGKLKYWDKKWKEDITFSILEVLSIQYTKSEGTRWIIHGNKQTACLSKTPGHHERAILNTPLFLLAVLFDFRLLVWWKQRYDYYLVTLTHIKRDEARCSGERNHYHTWGFPLGQINSESAVFRFTTSASQPRWRNMAVTERYSIKKTGIKSHCIAYIHGQSLSLTRFIQHGFSFYLLFCAWG